MTEAEWLVCNEPAPMLKFLQDKVSDRKLRLFACACCRRIWPLFKGEQRDWEAVLVSERYADGLATPAQLKYARKRTRSCESDAAWTNAYQAAAGAAESAANAVRYLTYTPAERDDIFYDDDGSATMSGCTSTAYKLIADQKSGQAKLLLDIFVNPFRSSPSLSHAVLGWNDSTLCRIAQTIYDDRAFDRLPILADALEDAGCDNADLLRHCREPGKHVRGCWVVDLLLGKE